MVSIMKSLQLFTFIEFLITLRLSSWLNLVRNSSRNFFDWNLRNKIFDKVSDLEDGKV